MRGKDPQMVLVSNVARITPAHAGKSLTELQSLSASKDHPRACGEKTGKLNTMFLIQGSPPRMRGKD